MIENDGMSSLRDSDILFALLERGYSFVQSEQQLIRRKMLIADYKFVAALSQEMQRQNKLKQKKLGSVDSHPRTDQDTISAIGLLIFARVLNLKS